MECCVVGVGPGRLDLQSLYQGWVSVFPEDPDDGQETLAWPYLGPEDSVGSVKAFDCW